MGERKGAKEGCVVGRGEMMLRREPKAGYRVWGLGEKPE